MMAFYFQIFNHISTHIVPNLQVTHLPPPFPPNCPCDTKKWTPYAKTFNLFNMNPTKTKICKNEQNPLTKIKIAWIDEHL
jgi:hypothetical protein